MKLNLLFTALFKNTRTLKFKSQLTFAFFGAVNHLNGTLRKQLNSFKQVQRVMVCDLWLVDFDPFSVFSRFIACDGNYYWRQWKTHLWRRLLDLRVRVFVKSSVRFHFWISISHLRWVILTQLWTTRPFQQKVLGTMVPPISQTAIYSLRENWNSSIAKWCGKKVQQCNRTVNGICT